MPEQTQPKIPVTPSEPTPSKPQPYFNQKAMEACLKAHPTLTEKEFKEQAEAFGF